MTKKFFKTVILNTLPVMTGYLVLGFGFGVLMSDKGIGIFWSFLASLIIYAGSMQFVLVNLITSGAGLIATAVTTLMVNARHLFYGISMVDKYKKTGRKKPYLMFALTDETYSLVCTGDTPSGINTHKYQFFVSLFNHIYWVTGSLLGATFGQVIALNTKGIDFCMTALFVTIFVEQWLTSSNKFPALTGLIVSAGCLFLFGKNIFLIPSMAIILIVLIVPRLNVKGEKK
ncbi:MAG: AzlC family ABC transporter permease [Clostridia bacterium]|nr:AzlC family ABC transporter permease [Clostridia bacterium]